MKWMGAGAALMGIGLPACRRVEKYLVPYNAGPEWSVPGVETAYSTSLSFNGHAQPVMAACYEGRPVKLLPSLQYPEGPGLSAAAQASILDLYDPNRSKHVLFNGQQASEEEFRGAFSSWARHVQNGGKAGFLLPPSDSPLRHFMLEDLRRKNPGLRLYSHAPCAMPGSAMQGGLPADIRFRVRFARVRRILALDCDFLYDNTCGNTKEFIAAHSPEGLDYKTSNSRRARLYAAEGRISLTGGHADHRLPVAPGRMAQVVNRLRAHISMWKGVPVPETPHAEEHPFTEQEAAWLNHCADDLCNCPGESLILLGDHHPELAPFVWELNHMLGAFGSCIQFLHAPPFSATGTVGDLIRDIEQKEVDMVFLLDCFNPVLEAANGRELATALKLTESVHLGLYEDETSRSCRWNLPGAHPLETWGIERDYRGRFCYRQPVVLPLFGGIASAEVLSGLLSGKGRLVTADNAPNHLSPVYHRARKCFERAVNPEQKTAAWAQALQRGYSDETVYAPLMPQEETQLAARLSRTDGHPYTRKTIPPHVIGLQFFPSYTIQTGEGKRNTWLQECPDPVTGVSWEASAQVSPATFRQLGGQDSMPMRCTLTASTCQMEVILCPTPGVADGLIILPLGYGGINPIADGQEQSNGYAFQSATAQSTIPAAFNEKNGKQKTVQLPPGAHAVSAAGVNLSPLPERTIAIQSPVFQSRPFNGSSSKNTSTCPPSPGANTVYQWRMAIDTARCIGCNACMVACRAENNIPVVGRDQMARGRALDWLRIDKYLTEQGFMTAVPVACQQCGKAPCESVCPVNATVHTTEGLNAMVYGRCWGTRYCAANCPYKARRFNFFDYAKASEQSTRLQRNPNVTVRSRGVMEKCTYCVQLVERAKIRHKSLLMQQPGKPSTDIRITEQDLLLPDGAAQTACQMACPMAAITFGNVLDAKSAVFRTKALPRHINLLATLGTEPGTGYLAPARNANPHMKEIP